MRKRNFTRWMPPGFCIPMMMCCLAIPLTSHRSAPVPDSANEILYRVVGSFPHDETAFTQGLVFESGFLYESTGMYGRSSLRQVDPESGRIIRIRSLSQRYFAEGITILNDRIYQLTWQSGTGFIYDKKDLKFAERFTLPLPREGWGLTTNGEDLIASDGSSRLYYISAQTRKVRSFREVRDGSQPLYNINELEYVDGRIYANIWQTAKIAVIDEHSAVVLGWMNLTDLVPGRFRGHPDYVLNGIAYDGKKKVFYVTGKMWNRMYLLKLLDP